MYVYNCEFLNLKIQSVKIYNYDWLLDAVAGRRMREKRSNNNNGGDDNINEEKGQKSNYKMLKPKEGGEQVEATNDDLVTMDYTPAKKNPPIHN